MKRAACVVVLGLGFACNKTKSQQEWREKAEAWMSDFFCQPTQYFRHCFDVDEAVCKQTMRQHVRACIAAANLPDRFDRDDNKRFGKLVGSCAGGAYENDLTAKGKRRDADPKCHDASAWQPAEE